MPTFADSVARGGRVVGRNRDDDPIELVNYDPAWPDLFDEMRARLTTALGKAAARIDHVGSTAVPGLTAKPVVDIQVSGAAGEQDDSDRDAIESQGLELRWIEPGHRYFRPPPGLPRLWQVHVCSIGSEWERVHLLFRDYLRAHPDVAAEYAALKQRLAASHRRERIAYNDAKAPFIESAVATAGQWAASTGWAP